VTWPNRGKITRWKWRKGEDGCLWRLASISDGCCHWKDTINLCERLEVNKADLNPFHPHPPMTTKIYTIISNVSGSFIPCQPISTYFRQNIHISTLQWLWVTFRFVLTTFNSFN
jgi:hypothetical protein